MSNSRYAPEFRIEINEAPIPAALRASISGVNYQSGLEGADRVELTVTNEGLRWLDASIIALDNSLALSLGYAPDPLTHVFSGEIVSQAASFPSGGAPTMTVAAQDRISRLQKGTRNRWYSVSIPSIGWAALPDVEVGAIVTLENGLVPVFDPVGAALSVILGQAQAVALAGDPDMMQKIVRKQVDESDYDFLKRIALENGWDMFIEHGGPLGGYQLRFQSGLDRLQPEVALKYGHSLIDFTPRISEVGQVASVSATVWVAAIKTSFTVTVGWDWDRMALTIDIRPDLLAVGKGPSHALIEEPVTPVSAPRKILSVLIPKLNQRLTGSGSTVGDPRIRAGAVLALTGLGERFGGLYRVTTATHVIDSGGYRTNFEVRKEIWFGAIPLLEQGAVRIVGNEPSLA